MPNQTTVAIPYFSQVAINKFESFTKSHIFKKLNQYTLVFKPQENLLVIYSRDVLD